MNSRQPIILWCGRQLTHDGYGSAARLHVGALREQGATVVAMDLASRKIVGQVSDATVYVEELPNMTRVRSVDPDRPITAIVHDRPDQYRKVAARGRAFIVGYSYWETTRLPQHWAGWMTSMDRIWTSSEFNRDAFVGSGVPGWMIDKVGIPVDNIASASRVSRDEHRKRWAESTVFLSVVSKAVGRRDLNMLFEGFCHAFTDKDDVALVLKVPPTGADGVAKLIEEVMLTHPQRRSGSWPSVYVVSADLTREQLVRLHASVDCYVSCERGDGWDLPAMDSLTVGVPVVTTDVGASTEFISDADCYIVPASSKMVSCDDTSKHEHPLYSGQYWPYVDPMDLSSMLRNAHADPEDRRARGDDAADRIAKMYDQLTVAEQVVALASESSTVDWRANTPALITIAKGESAWPKERQYRTMSEHPKMNEGVLLSLLSTPDFLHPRDPRSFLRAYKRATAFASSHKNSLKNSPVRRQLSVPMKVPSRSPVKKFASLAALRSQIAKADAKRADVAELKRISVVAQDYERSVSTGKSEHDAESLESMRRPIWGNYGPFVSPASDLARLEELRNRHLGERVFILGNGPSLVNCDLAPLAHESTFAVNRISLLFDEIDWRPNYFTLLDWKMGASIQGDLAKLDGITKFFPERFRGVLPSGDDTYWYWPRLVGEHIDRQFEPDLVKGVPGRATVLVTAIQQAFFLGFRDIYLIGVDASYTIPDTVMQSGPDKFGTGVRLNLESTADDDPNHFSPSYFGTGSKWHDPNVADMRRMFRIMRKGVERHGGRLLNATVGGSLEELERVDYSSLF